MYDCRNKKKKMQDGSQNVDLPPEMMHEIFSRLPVKPLCRFKLVSKSWESLISDPDFVANYSKAAFENEDVFFRRRRLLFTNIIDSGQHGIYSLDLDQFLSENSNAGVDGLVAAPTELGFVYNLVQRGGFPYPFVLGPCNGLFLARLCYGDYGYILINPVTKESKKLPKPPLWRPMEPFFCHIYGLGFDHSTNEYKVINGQQYFGGVVFSVYTLQTDSWRQIDCLFPYKDLHNDGVLVNGAVDRLAMKVGNQSWVIISFSLAEERVREIAVPPNTANQSIQLGAFRDWLCITSAG
ncbi:PREDICTED: F-box/kelch-repeat protein At3g06240-like [Fragaria vesca subsp. vesca]|uniref:F-box/kelch-repeat protein At3g06240-like n=1 Tax=Fragaria vesca subsp. vesca TaxID=101020 RepID=UPI0002C35FD4|nr:PREDICTED: F-box/kelch-repeat protein At3g06240-like [Fragaria vesca subsp. vesca]